MKKNVLMFFIFVSFFWTSTEMNAQASPNEQFSDSISQLKSDTFKSIFKNKKTNSTIIIKPEYFNQGGISDVSLLFQGKVPGVNIHNKGGDPNNLAIKTIRGINTIGSHVEPLVVIDGIPGASISNLDPNDIDSLVIIKDGIDASKYGMRGNMGVIEIYSKKSMNNSPVIFYHGQTGIATPYSNTKNMNADEFIGSGGINFGAKTNWFNEITRSGISHNHHLSGNLRKGKTGFRLSGNYRDASGILLNSGFTQFALRSNFNTTLINDKLQFDLNGSFTNRKSNLSFKEAFGYALIYNPTAPLYSKDSPFIVNENKFDGYFELPNLYEGYNPLAMLEQNKKILKNNNLNFSGRVQYQFSQNMGLSLNYGIQKHLNDLRVFYPVNANYGGNGAFWKNRGYVGSSYEVDNFGFLESKIDYCKNIGLGKIFLSTGYSFQQMNYSGKLINLSDFKEDYKYDEFSNDVDVSKGTTSNTLEKKSPKDRLIAFFADAKFEWKDYIFFHGSLRREGSSRLGSNGKWGIFPSLSGGLDLARLVSMPQPNQLILKLGYGITGNLPKSYGLSQKIEKSVVLQDSSIINVIVQDGNPDLKCEEKKEINFGIDFQNENIGISLNLYNRNIDNIIAPPNIQNLSYENKDQINTKGLEISMSVNLIQKVKYQYKIGLILSTYESILKKYHKKNELVGSSVDLPNLFSSNISLFKEGEEPGIIVGPVFESINENGLQNFKDLNGDGNIIIEREFAPANDIAILGSGLPDYEMGWVNEIKIGSWTFNAFIRGVFGHSLINGARLNFEAENIPGIKRIYNYVNTSKKADELRISRFSSLFVEKADFLKLDNITIQKGFSLKSGRKKLNLRFYVTGQNLFVITNYSGSDPEPALTDNAIEFFNFRFQPSSKPEYDLLIPGIDRRNNYVPSRSIVFGVKMDI